MTDDGRPVDRTRCDARIPVGLDGVLEGLCPLYHDDMRAAVEAFIERKFGPGGAYDPATPGPWRESDVIKASVEPYDDAMVDCLSEIAGYVYTSASMA